MDSSYTSQWVDFSSTELYDRNDNPLQTPDSQVEQIYTTYDQPPYTASNGFPFLYIAGRFVLFQTSYDPSILQGLSWKQIAADLGDPTSNVAQAIVGNANYLTAAICLRHREPAGLDLHVRVDPAHRGRASTVRPPSAAERALRPPHGGAPPDDAAGRRHPRWRCWR